MDNPFDGLDAATLTTLRDDAVACLQAILKNQSYSLNGRSLTRANLSEVKNMVGQLTSALNLANGTTTDMTFVRFNSANTW